MGALSRRKGRSMEQDIATMYRHRWPGVVVRRSVQAHRAYEPDVVVEGYVVPHYQLWTECFHGKAPAPLVKLDQAERDVAALTQPDKWLPIVVWRKHGSGQTHVTLRLSTLGYLVERPVILPADPVATLDFGELLRLIDVRTL